MTYQIVYGGYPTPMDAMDLPYDINSARVNGKPIRIREFRDGEGRISHVSAIGYIEGHRPTGGMTSGVLESTQEFNHSEVETVIRTLMDKYNLHRGKIGVVVKSSHILTFVN